MKYSLIIPHYRIPKLLQRCLSSIPVRDDLQVIVVDDYSGAEYMPHLRELEKHFPNVLFVFSDVNGGGGRARNIGLQYAEGEYVLFADADDFFNYCLNDVLDKYKHSDYDMVIFNASHIDTDTYLPTKRGTTLQAALKMYEKTRDISMLKYEFGEPWCKLIKREIIDNNNVRFDEIPIHNDTKFSYLAAYYANNVIFDNIALYTLADRSASVSKDLTDEKKKIRVKVFAEKNRFMADHNIPFFDSLMLTPFRGYLKQRDWENLEACFSVSESYGYSKSFVLKKLFIHKLKYVFFRKWITS